MERVLHVEDEIDIQAVAKIALEDIGGLRVESAGSGKEALAKVAAFAPDVILLDVMMPGMDGPATLRALRALPGAAHVPVVFMTAKIQSHEVEDYLKMGALGVLSKPFDPMTLAGDLQRLLEAKPA